MSLAFFPTPRVRTILQATSRSSKAQIPVSDKNEEKAISFVNFPSRDGTEIQKTVTFDNEAFLAFLHRNDVSALEEVIGESGSGNVVATFAHVDPDKNYILCYKKSLTEGRLVGIEGFARNSADSFEDKANLALVQQLRQMKHTGVDLTYSKTKLRLGKQIMGDIDGLVETDSHIFIVESKTHAQVCLPTGSFYRPSAPSLYYCSLLRVLLFLCSGRYSYLLLFLCSGRYTPAQ